MEMKVEGIKELGAKLEKLAEGVRVNITSVLLLELADDILVTARALVPKDTGALAASMDSWLVQEGSLTQAMTGSTKAMLSGEQRDSLYKGNQFYGGFIEFGHGIGKRGAGRRVGTKFVLKNDTRSRVAARPFLRPAFDEHVPKWLDKLPSRIQEEMDHFVGAGN